MNPNGPADAYYGQMSQGSSMPVTTVPSHSHYSSQQPPPLLQPGSTYAHQYGNPQYGYANALSSPAPIPPSLPPSMNSMAGQSVLPLPGSGSMNPAVYAPGGFDTTGQVAPPGMKPRVTATLWEDEGSLCFQVEARGICVARREDNAMINGTKLLNVAGMTRGRRDGILKSEKVRHVVKIGPMHLKGVWIPFERALDFANKEKITELLYPLFVHNIGALLYHPTNQSRTSQVMAAAEQRRKDSHGQLRGPPGLPSLQQHHHHSMLPGPPSLPSHPGMGRPALDRAHTFPTPPTSASSVMGPMGNSDGYQWSQQSMNGPQGSSSISLDTSLGSSSRSMLHTPATTPPGSTIQSMQNYPPISQSYDSSRQMYQGQSAQQAQYQSQQHYPSQPQHQERSVYSQSSYIKNDMGPPSGRSTGQSNDASDSKPPSTGMIHQGQGQSDSGTHAGSEEDDDANNEAEYTHDSGGYDANRGSYNYNTQAVNSLPHDHGLAPEIGGPPHQAGSGRATPRTAAAPPSYYSAQGYHTPPLKRGRDDDDDGGRPTTGTGMDMKRRKTIMDGERRR
ncbi:Cell pattern formation-associated protein asm-1 [Neurospora sp. IMI 360204]|nr:Cell pattern formation-associated protein asm-1 [Neurospora sp. IMI 360204]